MKIAQQAADPKAGMTLDEAARLIQQAMRSGIPGTPRPTYVQQTRQGEGS